MKLRLLFPVAIFLLLSVALAAVACGDDDDEDEGDGDATATAAAGSDDVEAYIRDVDHIQDDVTEATNSVGEQSEQAFADPPTARQALSSAVDIGEAAVASLQDLEPPDTAKPAHDELIAAGEELVTAVQGYADQLQGVEAGPAFEEIKDEAEADDSDLSMAIDRTIAACEGMQAYAEANNVEITLSCPDAP